MKRPASFVVNGLLPDRFTTRDRANGLNQFMAIDVLEQETRRAG